MRPTSASPPLPAQAANGKPGQFDYICIHPYETLGNLNDPDGEIPYLWMTKMLRDELKSNRARSRQRVPAWITEIGRPVDQNVSEDDAARAMVKSYIMAMAQGISHICWFEAQDPIGEQQGYGLLRRDGTQRPAYIAMKSILTGTLGETPKYLWLDHAFGQGNRSYGFLFQGAAGPVLVLWMPGNALDKTITFTGDVQAIDPLTSSATPLKAGQPLELTREPLLITSVPNDLVTQAQSNAAKPFPWGGNYSTATTVSSEFGANPKSNGVLQTHPIDTPVHTFEDGSSEIGFKATSAIRQSNSTPIPSFANVMTREYYIRITFSDGSLPRQRRLELPLRSRRSQRRPRLPMHSTNGWFSVGPDMA